MKTKLQFKLSLILCMMILVLSVNAQNEINVGKISPGYVDFAGFKLDQDGSVNIEATGASLEKWGNKLLFYGWIIESESRDVVWSMLDEYEREYFHGETSIKFNDNIELKKGSYEVYYASMYGNSYYKYQITDFTDIVQEVVKVIVDGDEEPYFKSEKFYLKVKGNKGFTVNSGKEYVDNISKKSIASFVRTGDNTFERKDFALSKETKLYIYGQGEKDGKEYYDFAWIYNLKTHERVWPDNLTDYERGGGGRKNFAVYQEVTFPAGDYQINYITDGSHSFDKWNVLPPHDPQFWGVSVWCDNTDMSNVSDVKRNYEPFVDITRVRDDEYESQGFEISETMDIRVICLGEIADYDPNDYGCIIDAKSREIVWKFTRSKSEYAGGSDKNRIVNEVISLDKGKYIAYYASDDSHSYGDWNAAPPHDQKLWGLSLWSTKESDKNKIKLFNEEELNDENVIVEITRVRDNKRYYENFNIDTDLSNFIVPIQRFPR